MATCLKKNKLKSVFPYGFRRQSIHWLCHQAKYVDTRTKKNWIVRKNKKTKHCPLLGLQVHIYPVSSGYWILVFRNNTWLIYVEDAQRKSALTLIVLRSETLRSQLILSQRPTVHINWNQTTSGDVGFNWWVVQMIKHENWVFWRHKTGRWIHLQYINLPNMWRVDSLFFVFYCLQINGNS